MAEVNVTNKGCLAEVVPRRFDKSLLNRNQSWWNGFQSGGDMEYWKVLLATMVGRQEKVLNSRSSRMAKTLVTVSTVSVLKLFFSFFFLLRKKVRGHAPWRCRRWKCLSVYFQFLQGMFFHTPFFLKRALLRLENYHEFSRFSLQSQLHRTEALCLPPCRLPKSSPSQKVFERVGFLRQIILDRVIINIHFAASRQFFWK